MLLKKIVRGSVPVLFLTSMLVAQSAAPKLPTKDAVRLREYYRLSESIGDKVWADWNKTPAPILLITTETEFLTRFPHPPAEFKQVADGLYARPRVFDTKLLASFPAFGLPTTIVIGEPENTDAKKSTPWLIVVMHEHFHQIQDSQPGAFEATNALGLARGDKTGMWMLNYAFPYDDPKIAGSFAKLRDSLLAALAEKDDNRFKALVSQHLAERGKFFAQLNGDDRKYFNFQLWKEGVARYVQIRAAEASAEYQPTPEYKALADYEPFDAYARNARAEAISELKKVDLATWKRVAVYPFGACEGLLLDRIDPKWKDGYFRNPFTLDPYFEKVH